MSLRSAVSAARASVATTRQSAATSPASLFMTVPLLGLGVTLLQSRLVAAGDFDDAAFVVCAAAERYEARERVARRGAERRRDAERRGEPQRVIDVLEPQHRRERDVAAELPIDHAPRVAH